MSPIIAIDCSASLTSDPQYPGWVAQTFFDRVSSPVRKYYEQPVQCILFDHAACPYTIPTRDLLIRAIGAHSMGGGDFLPVRRIVDKCLGPGDRLIVYTDGGISWGAPPSFHVEWCLYEMDQGMGNPAFIPPFGVVVDRKQAY